MNDTTASADIDLMVAELGAAGWTKAGLHVWQAPNGALFRGPAGAWTVMKREANDRATKTRHPA